MPAVGKSFIVVEFRSYLSEPSPRSQHDRKFKRRKKKTLKCCQISSAEAVLLDGSDKKWQQDVELVSKEMFASATTSPIV